MSEEQQAAELLRARGVNGKPEAKTSPETLAATYGLAKVREACRWADSRGKPACQLISGLAGGYALAPEPGSEAARVEEPVIAMTPEEKAAEVKKALRLYGEEFSRDRYRRIPEEEWQRIVEEWRRSLPPEEDETAITPEKRAEAHWVKAVTAAACGRLAWSS